MSAIGLGKSFIEGYAEGLVAQYGLDREQSDASCLLKGFVGSLGGRIRVVNSREWLELQHEALRIHAPNDFEIILTCYTGVLRDRFCVAHELGHYFLHSKEGLVVGARPRKAPSCLEEWEANWFALALLMPAIKFKLLWDLFPEDYVRLAGLFYVPVVAAKVRAEGLGLIKSQSTIS